MGQILSQPGFVERRRRVFRTGKGSTLGGWFLFRIARWRVRNVQELDKSSVQIAIAGLRIFQPTNHRFNRVGQADSFQVAF